MKQKYKKGFTLAELLVVVAIIAILVAVSIPIFIGKLNEAKENTDLANVRAAKAEAITAYLTQDGTLYGYDSEEDGAYVYDGYYNAENGSMQVDYGGIAGYNQFTVDRDTHEEGDFRYHEKQNIIYVKIIENKDSDPVVKIRWDNAEKDG